MEGGDNNKSTDNKKEEPRRRGDDPTQRNESINESRNIYLENE